MRKSLTLTLVLGMFLWILPLAGATAAGTSDPLVFHSLDVPCVAFDTRPGPGSGAGPLISEHATLDSMAFDIVGAPIGGPPDNFESQGGTPGGCGIPGFTGFFTADHPVTTAVLMNLVAINPSAGGNLRAYPTGNEGTGGIVNYQGLLSHNLNNSNAFTLSVRQDTQGQDITIEINGAPGSTVHARGIILGYFTPASHRVEHVVGLSGEFRNNTIGGSYDLNVVLSPTVGATIAGGGGYETDLGCVPDPPFQCFGGQNLVSGNFGTVGGGLGNDVMAAVGTISGGQENTTWGEYAAVAGGWLNSAVGESATVGGGHFNAAIADFATVSGGGPSDMNEPFETGNEVHDDYGTIGGGGGNRAGSSNDSDSTNARYATISGGENNSASAFASTVGGGTGNNVFDAAGTIGGGYENHAGSDDSPDPQITDNALYATVGGGYSNEASHGAATVAGGYNNEASGDTSVVAGGGANLAAGGWSSVGGGESNGAEASHATVAGGESNHVWDEYGTIGGGVNNVAGSPDLNPDTDSFATVGGGIRNTAGGWTSTVPGGVDNTASGSYSFAAGRRAQATHDGSFVWADSSEFDFISLANNEFAARAVGGVRFVTSTVGFVHGVEVDAGGSSWSSISSRDAKENYQSIDPGAVLEAVAGMPLESWTYKSQDESIRHIGPYAEDFHEAFGLGSDPDRITTIDADGVALAAIQGLYAQNQALQAQVDALQAPANGATGVSVTLLMLLVLGAAVVTGAVVGVVASKR